MRDMGCIQLYSSIVDSQFWFLIMSHRSVIHADQWVSDYHTVSAIPESWQLPHLQCLTVSPWQCLTSAVKKSPTTANTDTSPQWQWPGNPDLGLKTQLRGSNALQQTIGLEQREQLEVLSVLWSGLLKRLLLSDCSDWVQSVLWSWNAIALSLNI